MPRGHACHSHDHCVHKGRSSVEVGTSGANKPLQGVSLWARGDLNSDYRGFPQSATVQKTVI